MVISRCLEKRIRQAYTVLPPVDCWALNNFKLKVFLSSGFYADASCWCSTGFFFQASSLSSNLCKPQAPFSAPPKITATVSVSTVLYQGNKEQELRGGQEPLQRTEQGGVHRAQSLYSQWDCICSITSIRINCPLLLTSITIIFLLLTYMLSWWGCLLWIQLWNSLHWI